MDRVFNERVKGILTILFAGALIPAGKSIGLPEPVSIFLAIAGAAVIDVALRLRSRGFEAPMWEPLAGGIFIGMPVWFCSILVSLMVAGIYLGWLK